MRFKEKDVVKKRISRNRRIWFWVAFVIISIITTFLIEIARGNIRRVPNMGWHKVKKLADTGVSYYEEGGNYVLVDNEDQVLVLSKEELERYRGSQK